MDVFRTDRIRNVVLLGHGGAGKTTLAEAMAYLAGMTSRLGRVEDGNTVSDYDKEEIKRHFSITTSLIPVPWDKMKVNVLDTPGYFDFVGEVEEAVAAADADEEQLAADSRRRGDQLPALRRQPRRARPDNLQAGAGAFPERIVARAFPRRDSKDEHLQLGFRRLYGERRGGRSSTTCLSWRPTRSPPRRPTSVMPSSSRSRASGASSSFSKRMWAPACRSSTRSAI